MGCEASTAKHKKEGGNANSIDKPPHVISFPPKSSNNSESTKRKHETEFQQDALDAHNEYRKEHGVSPLSISTVLTKHAQMWAEELAKRDMLMHSNCTLSDGEMVGESIYTCWSSGSLDVKAKPVIRSWYNEKENYDFVKGDYSTKTGNFTQIVWKETKELGIAKARSNDGSVYVVANYKPDGNITGFFDSNVLPVQSQTDTRSESSPSSDSDSYDYYKIAALTSRIKIDLGDTKFDSESTSLGEVPDVT